MSLGKRGKLVFFDIDGTLWDQRMEIPESTAAALRGLKANGHRIFLCSGRSRSNIRAKKLLELGFDGIVAACGCHIEMDGKLLYEHLIGPELTARVIALREECRMPVVLEGPDYHWIDEKGFEEDPFVAYLFRDLGEYAIPLRGYTADIRINKFSADVLPGTDYGRIKAELSGEFNFLEHGGNVIEAVPAGISKATGIDWLCKHLSVEREDTYAVGDSANDLDMLAYVGHSAAMGNASDAAKAAAEYVTADIHADGVLLAMQHYGLLDGR